MKHIYLSVIALFLAINMKAQIADTITHERIYLGTGEYSPKDDWHAILRFDECENYNSDSSSFQYTPNGVIPLKQCYDSDSVMLNFGHGFYIDEKNNRMYLATIFTNENNYITSHTDTAVGSIVIFDGIDSLNGAQTPTRHIFGDSTQLLQPHGCWLDESNDMLYVANTFGESILVFHNASTINGNVAPDRVIEHDSLGRPVYIYIDTLVDRMFICAMPAGMPNPKSQVAIYDNASLLNGTLQPKIRITGTNTRLDIGNQTVHNACFNGSNQLLAVGHHTNELLFFDLDTVNWGTTMPVTYDLTPRIIRVDDTTLVGYDSSDVNLYGFFWDMSTDRMFCSVGVDHHGVGGPVNSSPPEAIKIFSNVSDSTVSGIQEPTRVIYWDNGNVYYPPQPIWVQKTQELVIYPGINEHGNYNKPTVLIGTSLDNISKQLSHGKYANVEIVIYNSIGQKLYNNKIIGNWYPGNGDWINSSVNGIYFCVIKNIE